LLENAGKSILVERSLECNPENAMKKSPAVSVEETASAPSSKGEAAKEKIISIAETLFSQHGFEATSIRDIAGAAKMQAASMYYYFPSKDEILAAVLEKGGAELEANVHASLNGKTGPWERMEAACVAHVQGLLARPGAFQVLFVMPPWHYPSSIKDRIIGLRDRYEAIFIDLVEALPLKKDTDRHYVRLAMIGALSWPLIWYKPDGDSPETVARQLFATLRQGLK
jgi:TetR/AcrR family transcriptional regulator, cholesterol catabolism regulator